MMLMVITVLYNQRYCNPGFTVAAVSLKIGHN
jgi:hypothetical protein